MKDGKDGKEFLIALKGDSVKVLDAISRNQKRSKKAQIESIMEQVLSSVCENDLEVTVKIRL